MKNRNLVFMSSAAIAIVLISILFFSQETNSLSKQIIDKCELDVDCGINGLMEISETNDEKTVLEVFGELRLYYEENISMNLKQSNVANCNEYGRHLGIFLYNYYGDYEKPISIADGTCKGFMYYAIIESYLVELENPDLIDLTSICTKLPRQLDRENLECVHYIGHVLYLLYENNIYVAAERCNDFTINYEIMRCSSGVYMENLASQRSLGFPDFKEDDPYHLCNSVSQEEFLRACYSYQSLANIIKNKGSAIESFEACDEVSEENKKFCYMGIGFMIVGNSLDDVSRIVQLCQYGDKEFHSECIKEAAFDFADHKDIQQGMELCKIAPDYTKEACYDGLGKWIILISDSEKDIEELCSQAENSKYSDICLDANWDTLL